jgi:hypothetical protein
MEDENESRDKKKDKFSLFTCSKKEFKEWFDPL